MTTETRLGAEYDPAEHHDLDRVEPGIVGPVPPATAFCACGWFSWPRETPAAARREHEEHRDEVLGVGCA